MAVTILLVGVVVAMFLENVRLTFYVLPAMVVLVALHSTLAR
ncbi:MAG: hypothetical protein R2867_45875 [Caldilineaceae bacterium]